MNHVPYYMPKVELEHDLAIASSGPIPVPPLALCRRTQNLMARELFFFHQGKWQNETPVHQSDKWDARVPQLKPLPHPRWDTHLEASTICDNCEFVEGQEARCQIGAMMDNSLITHTSKRTQCPQQQSPHRPTTPSLGTWIRETVPVCSCTPTTRRSANYTMPAAPVHLFLKDFN